jgi:hypothetical protein
MGGSTQLWVPPSSFTIPEKSQGKLTQGSLAAGYPDGTQVVTGNSVAGPNNLVSPSPPTLLEEFEVYSLSIIWDVVGITAGVRVLANLELLVNDRRAFGIAGEQVEAYASWQADLVNPIRLGARDRLGLRVGVELSTAVEQGVCYFMLGATYSTVGVGLHAESWTLAESTISYNVLDVPGSARL